MNQTIIDLVKKSDYQVISKREKILQYLNIMKWRFLMAVDPLSGKKLKYYEKILLKEKEKTLKLLAIISDKMKKGSKDSSGDLSSFAIHQADLGTDTANMEKEVYLLEEEQKKLKLLNQSLGRIYDKSYGICEITGEYISEKRLKTIPWANCSVEAKEMEEKKKRRKH